MLENFTGAPDRGGAVAKEILHPGPLQEQSVLLTAEPSLQPLSLSFNCANKRP